MGAVSFAQIVLDVAAVTWVLTPAYAANALATIPRGWGVPMDLGRPWPGDGRRILGPSKTWSGFLFAGACGTAIGTLEAWLILLAPPPYSGWVPVLAPSVALAVPFAALIAFGAMSGDALGSFVKRRLGRESGSRTLLLDQLPFVLVPIALGFAYAPGLFLATFGNVYAIIWVILFTLGLHVSFNWIGYHWGLKKVPW